MISSILVRSNPTQLFIVERTDGGLDGRYSLAFSIVAGKAHASTAHASLSYDPTEVLPKNWIAV
jgi:hypothetical protein